MLQPLPGMDREAPLLNKLPSISPFPVSDDELFVVPLLCS